MTQPRRATRQPETAPAAFKTHRGAVKLFVGNRSLPPLAADLLPNTPLVEIAACANVGVHLYRVRSMGLGWMAAGLFDHSPLESRLRELLASDPNAIFWIEVAVDAPDWWRRSHPDELAGYCLPSDPTSDTPSCASWASRRWLTDAGDALARLVRAVYREEWRGRCLGFQIAAGTDGEWRHPDPERLPDIGPRMTERFRAFALEKYRRNTALLRQAWDDPRAEFERIACPNAPDRKRADFGIFRSPKRFRRMLDYYECFADAQNTAALRFCDVVKRASDDRALVGLAYAHTFDQPVLAENGHGCPEPVLASPDVDFFANVGPAGDTTYPRGLTGSLALREKFLFHVASPGQSAARAISLTLAHNAGLLLPVASPAEDFRAALDAFAQTPTASGTGRRKADPLAVIVDPASLSITSLEAAWLHETLLTVQIRELAKLDVPFDLYQQADLFHPRFPEYSVTLFLNSFYLSEAERRRIDARVKRSGKTAVWLWAPGVVGEEGVKAESGGQTCGLKLRLEQESTNLRVRIVEASDPLTQGLAVGMAFGVDRPVSPTVTITDRSVLRLGANTANKTAFAIRRFDTWTSIVCGAVPVPAILLRHILRAAESAETPPSSQRMDPPGRQQHKGNRGRTRRKTSAAAKNRGTPRKTD